MVDTDARVRLNRRRRIARLLFVLGTALGIGGSAALFPRAVRAELPAMPLRLDLIDTPTAQLLPRGTYEFSLRLLGGGSAIGGARVGMLDAFTFGFHYGGTEIVASGDPDWNPRVEFYAKLRVLRESVYPAFAIGFDSQGLGAFDDSLDRYEVKSRGLFAVAEKTWPVAGFMSLQGGISRSLEDNDDDDSPTLFGGIQKSLGDRVVFLAEYDLALNDNDGDGQFGRGRGYLNTSFSWAVSEALSLEFDIRNLTENSEQAGLLADWNREIRFRYAEFF